MSLIIVPLAGPDFYTEKFGIRPLHPVGESTLIQYVLSKRSWMREAKQDDQLVFVLREIGKHTDIMKEFIHLNYPHAQTVTISTLSSGATFSALAGLSLAKKHDQPVIIDLADIAFDLDFDPELYFKENPSALAVVPYFPSNDSKFSYLRLDGKRVLEAREKIVISSNASAGVYCFKNVSAYLKAVDYSVQNPSVCTFGPAYFVCPSVNGLISETTDVHALEVHRVQPISTLFHEL
jgi:hypothetical protein